MFEECMKQMVHKMVWNILRSDEGMEWLREHTNAVIERSLMEMNIPEMVDDAICERDFMDEESVGRMIDSALGDLSVEITRR